ncbi:MAG: SLC13 family permease [Chloroflexi bacterium]|nr:SLC13 family permease [Chloroflexota bacterium]
MTSQAIFVLIVTLGAAALLISERIRADVVALLVMVILGLSGIVTPNEVFRGFSGSAVMTILGISIISEGLHETGVTHWLGRMMARLGKNSERRLALVVILTSAGLSLFMNNIAAVGVLLPAVMSLCRQNQVPPSRLLLPLAYGTILGGMATLLTTSNIIVSGALREAGYQAFGLLDFLPGGIPIVAVGTLYMLTLGRKMLPHVSPKGQLVRSQQLRLELANLYQLNKNLYEIEVLPDSPLSGMSISSGRWAQKTGLLVLGLIRNSHSQFAPGPEQVILAGDHVMVQGSPRDSVLADLGLRLIHYTTEQSTITDDTTTLAELVVSPHATFNGKSLKEISFREKYNLNVLSIWRAGQPIQADLADTPLQFGDALLVQGSAASIRLLRQEPNLVLLEEDPDAIQKPGRHLFTLLITLLTLGIASTGILPVAVVVMSGAVLLLLTNIVNANEAYHAIEWRAIFLIAGMWPLSTAIRTTGLADSATQALLSGLGRVPPLAVAGVLILLAFILTQVMSGQVSALVLAPLALSAAQWFAIDPRGMGIAVALGCSLAFATPFGHPVNVMVMGPGGYTFQDYWKIGAPLTGLIFLTILLGLKIFWGF